MIITPMGGGLITYNPTYSYPSSLRYKDLSVLGLFRVYFYILGGLGL